MLDLSPALIAFFSASAALLGTFAGFGTSALLLPLLLFFLPLPQALLLTALIHLSLDCWKTLLAPHAVVWRFVASVAPFAIAGSIFGGFIAGTLLTLPFLNLFLHRYTPLLIIALLLSLALSQLRRDREIHSGGERTTSLLAFSAGFASALTGVGNVILAPLAMRSLPPSAPFLATTGIISALTNGGRIIGYLSGFGFALLTSLNPSLSFGAVGGAIVGFSLALVLQRLRTFPAPLLHRYALVGLLGVLLVETSMQLFL